MAIKFQYNKTSLQDLEKQLKVRLQALPILKSKEAALRVEVKRARMEALKLEAQLQQRMQQYQPMMRLWGEFDRELVQVELVEMNTRKIAGIVTPELRKVWFKTLEYSLFNQPYWFADGIFILKELSTLAIEKQIFIRKMELLDRARKKTTQKLNLYEKVQIPEYEGSILKIKRFLEDEDNLSKSAQKIVKNRLESGL